MALIESGVDLSPITVPLFKLELTVYWRVLKRGASAPLSISSPSPWKGEGDTGGEVNKTTSRILVSEMVEWG